MAQQKKLVQTFEEVEKNIKKTTKSSKKNPKKPINNIRYKIVDLEKENEIIQNQLEEITSSLHLESKNRKDLLKEVNNNIDLYSSQLLEYENKINQYELQEIKYKNQERELQDYIEMYNTKNDQCNEEVTNLNAEVIRLRKKIKSNEVELSSLKSIVSLTVNQYGLETISSITGIESSNIEKYLQE